MDLLNIIIISIAVLGAVNNGILLLIFVINPLKTFTSTSTYFIKTLTVADLVTSLMVIIGECIAVSSKSFSRAYYFFSWMSVQISFYLIFIMAIERYIAVHYPLKKQVIVTRERTLVCVFIVCSFSAILAGISEIKTIRFYILFSLFCLFDLIVTCVAFVYIKILVSLKKISAEVRRSCRLNSARQLRLGLDKIKEDRQLLIVVLIMLTVLVVTVLPYTLASQVLLVDRLFYKDWSLDRDMLRTFAKYYFPVEMINFAVNPIIYAIRLPNYRKSLMALLNCFFRSEINQDGVTAQS